jgi:hypothetical protein
MIYLDSKESVKITIDNDILNSWRRRSICVARPQRPEYVFIHHEGLCKMHGNHSIYRIF